MAQNLTQNFVDLSVRGFGSNRATELTFNHGENCLHVRPLVVVNQEGIPIEVVVMPHSIPKAVKLVVIVSHASRVRFERNVSPTTLCLNRMEISSVRIGLVSRNLIDIECLGSCADERRQLGGISRFEGSSFHASYNVSSNPTYKVSLDPCLLTAFFAIFMVEPPRISSGSEARGINGKVSLYSSQGTCTLLNHGFKEWSQFGILKITSVAGKGWRFIYQFLCLGFSQVRHKTPTRHCSISLISNTKHHVSQWQSRPSELIFGLGDTIAEVSKQVNKAFLFVHLSIIVSWPFLSASHLHRASLVQIAPCTRLLIEMMRFSG
jgi:hypothetical protein